MCITCNLESTLSDLSEAKKLMDIAWVRMDTEKILNQGAGISHTLGLENHKEEYKKLKEFIEQRIQEKTESQKKAYRKILERCYEYQQVEEHLISQGKTPWERDHMDYKFLNENLKDIEAQICVR